MRNLIAIGLMLGVALASAAARAETMSQALTRAYLGNPALNESRAATRVADESVAKALSGYRPRVEGKVFGGFDEEVITNRRATSMPRNLLPSDATLAITQNLYDGNRTINQVRRAESQDLGSREALRESEQETLLAGATAYMDVLRDSALEALARNQITVLEYELRGARARYRAQEVTATDVAQVAAQLAQGRTIFFRAEAALATSVAAYRRIVGTPPSRLEAARPVDELAPASLDRAAALALAEHPRIAAAFHEVDAAEALVHVREGALLPTVEAIGKGELTAERRLATNRLAILDAQARLAVPVYEGGAAYAEIRQAEEQVAAARLKAESAREAVRAGVAAAWAQLAATRALIASSNAAVAAAEVALVEVREEAAMGQRTTKDVLLAIQTLFAARAALVGAQRDRVVSSYELAAATGRLAASTLGLRVTPYEPAVHYAQVRDKWLGLRTPDGR